MRAKTHVVYKIYKMNVSRTDFVGARARALHMHDRKWSTKVLYSFRVSEFNSRRKVKRTRKLNLCSDERKKGDKKKVDSSRKREYSIFIECAYWQLRKGECILSLSTLRKLRTSISDAIETCHYECRMPSIIVVMRWMQNSRQTSPRSMSTPKTTTTICRWHRYFVVVVVGLCVRVRQAKQFVWLFELFSNWFLALHCELADFVPSVFFLCHKHMTVAIDNETQFRFWLSPSPLPFSRHGWMNVVSCCSCRKLLFVQQETHPIILLLCGSCNVCGHVKAQRHRQGRRKWEKLKPATAASRRIKVFCSNILLMARTIQNHFYCVNMWKWLHCREKDTVQWEKLIFSLCHPVLWTTKWMSIIIVMKTLIETIPLFPNAVSPLSFISFVVSIEIDKKFTNSFYDTEFGKWLNGEFCVGQSKKWKHDIFFGCRWRRRWHCCFCFRLYHLSHPITVNSWHGDRF